MRRSIGFGLVSAGLWAALGLQACDSPTAPVATVAGLYVLTHVDGRAPREIAYHWLSHTVWLQYDSIQVRADGTGWKSSRSIVRDRATGVADTMVVRVALRFERHGEELRAYWQKGPDDLTLSLTSETFLLVAPDVAISRSDLPRRRYARVR